MSNFKGLIRQIKKLDVTPRARREIAARFAALTVLRAQRDLRLARRVLRKARKKGDV